MGEAKRKRTTSRESAIFTLSAFGEEVTEANIDLVIAEMFKERTAPTVEKGGTPATQVEGDDIVRLLKAMLDGGQYSDDEQYFLTSAALHCYLEKKPWNGLPATEDDKK